MNDPASFNLALEVVKRYVRAKIKKGKGEQVAAKGGKVCSPPLFRPRTEILKLEQLEAKVSTL